MAFVDNDGTELILEFNQIVHPSKCLHHSNREALPFFLLHSKVLSDFPRGNSKKGLNSLNPLIEQLFAMNQYPPWTCQFKLRFLIF